jgi:hypothetical protein
VSDMERLAYLLGMLWEVSCSDEWEIGMVTHLGSHGARGVVVPLLA